MSRVLSLRLKDEQMARLQRLARCQGQAPSKAAALLIEEALRVAEFPQLEFRDAAGGRQAYVQGSRVSIWMLASLARDYEEDPERVAEHLGWPLWRVQGGLDYARDFPEEIDAAIADNDSYDLEKVGRLLPHVRVFTIDDAPDEAKRDAGDEATAGPGDHAAPAAR